MAEERRVRGLKIFTPTRHDLNSVSQVLWYQVWPDPAQMLAENMTKRYERLQ